MDGRNGTIIISCAGDNALAEDLHEFLKDTISNSFQASIKDDELYVEAAIGIRKKELNQRVKELLDAFINSNEKYRDYKITNIEDIFTLGLSSDGDELGLFKCSWCGLLTRSKEEAELHENIHGSIGMGGGIGL